MNSLKCRTGDYVNLTGSKDTFVIIATKRDFGNMIKVKKGFDYLIALVMNDRGKVMDSPYRNIFEGEVEKCGMGAFQ